MFIGLDLIEIVRIAQAEARHGSAFLQRVYTPAERAAAQTRGLRRTVYLAGRFAAKEAVAKALGTGIGAGVSWQNIEVLNDASGAPVVSLYLSAAMRARQRCGAGWRCTLSLTDTRHTSAAVAVLTAGG